VRKHVDLEDRKILEPAGGTGEFINGFIRAGIKKENIVSVDIEPHHPLVKQSNYLETTYNSSNFVSITNPPFGRASSLAKKFFNHGADHCDYICYLIPKAWRKWSTQNSLDKRFHLIADIDMPADCFYLPGQEKKEKGVLQTVFQIWEKRDYDRKKIAIPNHGLIKKIIPTVSPSGEKFVEGANYSIIAFGHSCGRCEEISESVVPYKTTTMYLNVQRQDVKDALPNLELAKYYNNVSYVQALSIQEINYELNKKFGLDNS